MALSKEIGIDLGTANILIYVKGEGIVVNEPSVVSIDEETKKPLAVGQEAKDMLGKTPGRVQAIRPLKDGVIADFRITEILLTHFINKLNLKGIFARPTILICCPSNITSIEKSAIKSALLKFTGANRRFEFKGKVNGANIFDDYGHHPTEIIATAKSLMNKKYNKSWVVFQPHTYSRTKTLLDDFAKALLNFDNIIVLDIYAARETNTFGISSKDLVNKIISLGKDAKYIPDFEECVNYLKNNVSKNDIIMTLGAGTVTKIGPMLAD